MRVWRMDTKSALLKGRSLTFGLAWRTERIKIYHVGEAILEHLEDL
jgi:hypothetical protein